MEFKILFKPIGIGGVQIKNRIAMAPMAVGSARGGLVNADGTLTQRAIDYYVERAKGGVGLIITGVNKVENKMEGMVPRPFVSSKASSSLGELAEAVHHYGSKIFIQLTAGYGRCLFGELIDRGVNPVSASPISAYHRLNVTTRALTTEEVEKLVRAFGPAAEMVATAEIDGIELHGHQGYLFDQFTTALWNKRTDKYGGDLESRLRFPIEVVETIKDTVGKDFPIDYRYGLKHYLKTPQTAALTREGYIEAGRDVEEGLEMAKHLEKAGVDALHVDAGCWDSAYWPLPPIYQPHGCMINMAAEVKKAVNIPVIAVGRLDIPDLAEKVVKEGKADMIALGKGLLADPYWPKKVQEGRTADIRPCIGDHDGCIYRLTKGRPLSCSVNPSTGRERLYGTKPAKNPKRIFIAGGGVAGMEAARVAAIREHKVTLYEKNDKLGGHLIEASVPNFKKDIKRLLDWYIRQIRKLKVQVHLNTQATCELVERVKPDVVIVATGSTPVTPDIPGIQNRTMVVSCCDLLLGKKKAGNTSVVLGGGLVGCETALWLAKQGKSVTIVERLPELVSGFFDANRNMLLDMLDENEVEILTNTSIQEVTEDGVTVINKKFMRKVINCDSVVLAVGLKPEKNLYQSLLGEIAEIYAIGDCQEPRKIQHAIWDGYNVGRAVPCKD